ncbi:MAG: hypothetical protein P4L33_14460 [Capsulimonadaceae bacterium]|nr:hypothetical protein [Capsulimonadaceae bacterium]
MGNNDLVMSSALKLKFVTYYSQRVQGIPTIIRLKIGREGNYWGNDE